MLSPALRDLEGTKDLFRLPPAPTISPENPLLPYRSEFLPFLRTRESFPRAVPLRSYPSHLLPVVECPFSERPHYKRKIPGPPPDPPDFFPEQNDYFPAPAFCCSDSGRVFFPPQRIFPKTPPAFHCLLPATAPP